ncbi:MAG: PqqD family protein [Candidatus Cryptobacteroides sp.]|nr:PqqD family protein [Candidatus Cryptobacteroides sp.]
MKLNDSLRLRKMGRRYMIVKDGPDINLTDVFTLNDTAADIWEAFSGKEFSAGDVTAYMVANYDVPEETAAADVAAMLDEWDGYGLLQR